MSELFPEKPVLFYPSLAQRYGVNEAILLSLLEDSFSMQAMSDGKTEVLILEPAQFECLATFWTQDQLNEVLRSLDNQRLLQVSWGQGGTLKIIRYKTGQPVAPVLKEETSLAPSAASLPVYDSPPTTMSTPKRRSPAPVFGGNAGWRRGKDELQQIFDRREEHNQRLTPMTMGWKPSAAFHDMLSRQSITSAFADQCLDEFVLYWLDKDRKETNWDQKFLAWVKREWVHKQSREATGRKNEQQPAGQLHENTRRDTRENRKRVTAAIMDIKDTDW